MWFPFKYTWMNPAFMEFVCLSHNWIYLFHSSCRIHFSFGYPDGGRRQVNFILHSWRPAVVVNESPLQGMPDFIPLGLGFESMFVFWWTETSLLLKDNQLLESCFLSRHAAFFFSFAQIAKFLICSLSFFTFYFSSLQVAGHDIRSWFEAPLADLILFWGHLTS